MLFTKELGVNQSKKYIIIKLLPPKWTQWISCPVDSVVPHVVAKGVQKTSLDNVACQDGAGWFELRSLLFHQSER
jgi:hypothetical protein